MGDSALGGGNRPSEKSGPAAETLVDGEELARLHVFVGCAVRAATGRDWWGMRTAGEWAGAARAVGVTPVPLPGVPDFTPKPVLAGGRWLYYYPAGASPGREARWLAAGVAWVLIYQDRHRLPVAGGGRRTHSRAPEAAFLRVAAQTFVASVFGRGDHGYLGRVRHLPPAPSAARLVLSESAPLAISWRERWMPPEAPRPAQAVPVGARKGDGVVVSECEAVERATATDAGGAAGAPPRAGDGGGGGVPGYQPPGGGYPPARDEFDDYLRRLPGAVRDGPMRIILEQIWMMNRQVEAVQAQSEAIKYQTEAVTIQTNMMSNIMGRQLDVIWHILEKIDPAAPPEDGPTETP